VAGGQAQRGEPDAEDPEMLHEVPVRVVESERDRPLGRSRLK